MIITKMKGALGNQMFQYAMARRLALVSKGELKLDIGASPEIFQKNTARRYDLGHFNISTSLASEEEIKKLKYPYGIISKLWRGFQFWILKKYNVEFDSSYLVPRDKIYLDGFWQSEKYFKDIRDVILREFTLKESFTPEAQMIKDEILSSQIYSVSLHVRRGDYISDPETYRVHGVVCNSKYYEEALKKMEEKVGKFKLFIFSDDIEWVKSNLKFPYSTTFVTRSSIPDYQEIPLMSSCNCHILANSSFSWWGAWLNDKKEKVVIAPKSWTSDPNSHKDIAPPSWIRI